MRAGPLFPCAHSPPDGGEAPVDHIAEQLALAEGDEFGLPFPVQLRPGQQGVGLGALLVLYSPFSRYASIPQASHISAASCSWNSSASIFIS